jgi:integrase
VSTTGGHRNSQDVSAGRGEALVRRGDLPSLVALAGKRKGDLGALAAALPLLTGMRASEITNLRRRDLDDGGKILWVQEGKTEAARRRFVVPEVGWCLAPGGWPASSGRLTAS